MLSVNQLNAQVKLLEVWKAMNVEDYPLKIKQQEVSKTDVSNSGRLLPGQFKSFKLKDKEYTINAPIFSPHCKK